MRKKLLELTGSVISTRAADQSVLIKSLTAPKRIRVYAYDSMFDRLVYPLAEFQGKGINTKKWLGTFYIQGRVLMRFDLCGQTSRYLNETPKELKGEKVPLV